MNETIPFRPSVRRLQHQRMWRSTPTHANNLEKQERLKLVKTTSLSVKARDFRNKANNTNLATWDSLKSKPTRKGRIAKCNKKQLKEISK